MVLNACMQNGGNMTRILAIDAATEGCSVALYQDGKIEAVRSVSPQGHTRLLLPYIDDVLKKSGLRLSDLDAVACGRGPGSFTGVRISVSMAQALAFGAEKPLIGIVDLEAMALRAHKETGSQYVVSAIDARMGEVYLGIYEISENVPKAMIPEAVTAPEKAVELIRGTLSGKKFTSVGTGFGTYPVLSESFAGYVSPASDNLPDAVEIAELAAGAFADGRVEEPENVLPVYLRDNVSWKKVSEQHA